MDLCWCSQTLPLVLLVLTGAASHFQQKTVQGDSASSLPRLPPLVVSPLDGAGLNTLKDLETEYRSKGFSSNAVNKMTATVTSDFNLQCPRHSLIQVSGNMDCLTDFWDFQPFSPNLEYKKFVEPASQRDACRYSIGYKECNADDKTVSQVVENNPGYLVDGSLETVWAQKIGSQTQVNIDLHGTYKILAIAMNVETIPLDVTFTLTRKGHSPVVATRLKQDCQDQDTTCQKFLFVTGKQLVISWDLENSDDMTADHMKITFSGVRNAGPYETNYLIIRDLKLLAKQISPPKRTLTESNPSPTNFVRLLRAIAARNQRRQNQSKYGQYYSRPNYGQSTYG